MLVSIDQISNIDTLTKLLAFLEIEVSSLPALPVSLQNLLYFLQEQSVDPSAISRFIEHVNVNARLFQETEREHPGSFWWPGAMRDDQRTLDDELFWSIRRPIVSKTQSKIVSLGSCFAVEVAKHLQRHGYRYLVTEANPVEGTDFHQSSARWGTIFNAYGFLQVVSWAFGFDRPPMICFDNTNGIRDPSREDVIYTQEEANRIEEIWADHLICSRAALQDADIIILTVGLNEVFRYLPTGHYLHRSPYALNPALWMYALLSPEENYEALKLGIERLRRFNPKAKFIISVSPVPLARTFRHDVHVAAATSHSKAVLRVAIEKLCADVPDVHYMASFETVMYSGRLDAWDVDRRHVSRGVVQKIMRLFETQFCEP